MSLLSNKTVKIAEKRAMVDAVLRCAGLSQWFTQDLEELAYVAPDPQAAAPTQTPTKGQNMRIPRQHAGPPCGPTQCAVIRVWLTRAKRSEAEITRHFGVNRLEDLTVSIADKVTQRLMELAREHHRR